MMTRKEASLYFKKNSAYHEAGHAVIGTTLGTPCSAHIFARRRGRLNLEERPWGGRTSIHYVEGRGPGPEVDACIGLAGSVAAVIWMGVREGRSLEAAAEDAGWEEMLEDDISDTDRRGIGGYNIDWLAPAVVVPMVVKHWGAIDRVARYLIRNRRISCHEVARLLVPEFGPRRTVSRAKVMHAFGADFSPEETPRLEAVLREAGVDGSVPFGSDLSMEQQECLETVLREAGVVLSPRT